MQYPGGVYLGLQFVVLASERILLLHVCAQAPDHTVHYLNGLADLLVQDRGQLSRAVKSMVERGLLTRTRKPGGPEIEITLADAGVKLRERMVERAIERDRFLTEGIDPADLDVVRRVVEAMIERAELLMEEAVEDEVV